MGKGLANPVGTFWSVVMLLEHLGETDAAKRVMSAIEQVTANPALHTRDLGGKATTAQVTQAVCELLARQRAAQGRLIDQPGPRRRPGLSNFSGAARAPLLPEAADKRCRAQLVPTQITGDKSCAASSESSTSRSSSASSPASPWASSTPASAWT